MPTACQQPGCRTRAFWVVWYRTDGSDTIFVCRNHLHMAANRLELFRNPGEVIKVRGCRNDG